MDINFRSEVKEMIEESGIDILYRRKSKLIKCLCFNELHKSADPECEVCQGTGRMIAFEKIKLFANPNAPNANNMNIISTDMGPMLNGTYIIVGDERSHLTIGDTIYMVGWEGRYPVTLHGVLEITSVNVMRQQNGRVEYYLGYGKINTVEIDRAKTVLKKITGKEVEVRV